MTQETGGQELRERFRAVLASSDQADVLDKLMDAAGYGTHRCVRCGQPQAKEGDTCPPCDGEIYREEILELRDEIKRLTEDGEAGAKHIVEQAAENQRLRVELDAKDAQIERLAEEREQYQRAAKIFQALRLVLDTGQAPSEWAKPWRERAETAEAEWGRLRAAVERVRRLIDKGPSRRCGGQRYILANLISAALDKSDTSTPQQAADGMYADGTGRNEGEQ